MLKNLKVLVEIVSEYEIKALKFDNRGEFTLIEFNIFCEKHDIWRPLTITKSSQQNGVVKRKNKTIINMI